MWLTICCCICFGSGAPRGAPRCCSGRGSLRYNSHLPAACGPPLDRFRLPGSVPRPASPRFVAVAPVRRLGSPEFALRRPYALPRVARFALAPVSPARLTTPRSARPGPVWSGLGLPALSRSPLLRSCPGRPCLGTGQPRRPVSRALLLGACPFFLVVLSPRLSCPPPLRVLSVSCSDLGNVLLIFSEVRAVVCKFPDATLGVGWWVNRSADDSPRRRHCRAEVLMPVVDRSPTAVRRRSQGGRFRVR